MLYDVCKLFLAAAFITPAVSTISTTYQVSFVIGMFIAYFAAVILENYSGKHKDD